MDLQEYGEFLMKNKSGSIVAIEPKTGRVFALISSPDYDPGLLVGRIRFGEFCETTGRSSSEPLFNRALMASYPPGSTFKPVSGLIGLQENVITPSTMFYCNNGYLFVACHSHVSPLNIIGAIKNSCNAYFCQVFRRVLENPHYLTVPAAYDKWKNFLSEFGFGSTLGTDFVNEKPGFIPAGTYYDKYYGKNKWKALNIISLSIGQGEIEATPSTNSKYDCGYRKQGLLFQSTYCQISW